MIYSLYHLFENSFYFGRAFMSSNNQKKEYIFGGIKEYSLEEIEKEVLSDSTYLDVFAGSDIRFKKGVASIENSLQKIMMINGVSFEYENPKIHGQGPQLGVIAQDLVEVFPQAVRRKDDGLYVNYSSLIPVLIESVKELSEKVKEQEKTIELLKKRLL